MTNVQVDYGQKIFTARIVGVTDLIMDQVSERVKDEWEGKTTIPPPVEQQLEEKIYRDRMGRPAIPGYAMKAALINGARMFKSISMTEVRQLVFVETEWMPLWGEEPYTDPIRIDRRDVAGKSGKVLVHRPSFMPWCSQCKISFYSGAISLESVVALVVAAGKSGLLAWRPQKGGWAGTFALPESKEAAEDAEDPGV